MILTPLGCAASGISSGALRSLESAESLTPCEHPRPPSPSEAKSNRARCEELGSVTESFVHCRKEGTSRPSRPSQRQRSAGVPPARVNGEPVAQASGVCGNQGETCCRSLHRPEVRATHSRRFLPTCRFLALRHRPICQPERRCSQIIGSCGYVSSSLRPGEAGMPVLPTAPARQGTVRRRWPRRTPSRPP